MSDPAERVGELPAPAQFLSLGGQRVTAIGFARVWVCGITPYDVTHLGHASTFVWADLVTRTLDQLKVFTRSVRNVTDVDDVLFDVAQSRGLPYDEYALTHEADFDRDMAALRVARPAVAPRARHYMAQVQQLAAALLASGAAYERDGTVWFRGAGVAASSGLSPDEAQAAAAAYGDHPDDPAKDDPFDVPVWRPSQAGVPAWPSPWGWGRPGWHAECAAMALDTLGPAVDVLAGGAHLAFPHHGYQSAMVEAASGSTPFARALLHVGDVRINGEKMAKSTGNLVLVADLLREHEPAAVRLMLLDRPYADPWDFDLGALAAAQQRLDALRHAAATPGAGDPGPVVARLLDNLDVPGAVSTGIELGGKAAAKALSVLRLGD